MKTNAHRAPRKRNPLAAQLAHGAYQPKRVPSALQKARDRAARPKHRHDLMVDGDAR